MALRVLLPVVLLGCAAISLAPPGSADARELLLREEFTGGFVGNEQEYLAFEVPSGYVAIRGHLLCNLHVGSVTLIGPTTVELPCHATSSLTTVDAMMPGYYYGVASLSGVNGAALEITGVAAE